MSVYNHKNQLEIGPNPVLADTASNFWNEVKSNGYDVRFTDQYGQEVNFWYPVAMFDKTNRKAHFFVKVPAGTTEIRIYWGNENAGVSGYMQASQVAEWVHTFEVGDEGWHYETGWGDEYTGHSEGRDGVHVLEGSYAYKMYMYSKGPEAIAWHRWASQVTGKSVVAYINYTHSQNASAEVLYIKLLLGDKDAEADLSKENTWQLLQVYSSSAEIPKLEVRAKTIEHWGSAQIDVYTWIDMVMALKPVDPVDFNVIEFISG